MAETVADSPTRSRARLRLLLLVGAALLLALAVRVSTPPDTLDDAAAVEALVAIAPAHLRTSLPDVELQLLNIEVREGSSARVKYEHDELFDVVFVYRRDGQTRTFTAAYGRKDGNWITPTGVEIRARDEGALVVQR